MVAIQELAFVILIGMLFALFLCYTIIVLAKRNRQIQEMSVQLVSEIEARKELEKLEIVVITQDEERNKIARILHDEVGAILSLAHRNLLNVLDNHEDRLGHIKTIELCCQYVNDGIQQLRIVSKGLVPQYLLKFGLVKALKKMTYQNSESLVDSLDFVTSISEDQNIPEFQATHFFYIVNELMTNLIKHSFPSSVTMNLDLIDEKLFLRITHNGIALSQRDYQILQSDSEGLGLENIGYRLSIIHGDLRFYKFDSYGTIELVVSLSKPNET